MDADFSGRELWWIYYRFQGLQDIKQAAEIIDDAVRHYMSRKDMIPTYLNENKVFIKQVWEKNTRFAWTRLL